MPTTEQHPALVELPWEWKIDYPPGIHGIASKWSERKVDFGPIERGYSCYCGHEFVAPTFQEAFDALVTHASEPEPEPREPYGSFPSPCPSAERCQCGSICEAREAAESWQS